MKPRSGNRSRCPVCGYAAGLAPGRTCPECGDTLEADVDGFRKRETSERAKTWVIVAVVVLLIALAGLPVIRVFW